MRTACTRWQHVWQRHEKRSPCSVFHSFRIMLSLQCLAEFHPSHTPSSETKPTKEKSLRSERGRGSRASSWLLDSMPQRYMTMLVMPQASRQCTETAPSLHCDTEVSSTAGSEKASALLARSLLLASKTCTRAWPYSPRPKKRCALLSRLPVRACI